MWFILLSLSTVHVLSTLSAYVINATQSSMNSNFMIPNFNFTIPSNYTIPFPFINQNFTNQYQQSLMKWNVYKNRNNDCYKYTSANTSISGSRSATVIDIKNGMAEKRSYFAFNHFNNNSNITDSYIELDSSQIGTNTDGAHPKSIDTIYEECKNYLSSINTDDNDIFFQTDDYGLIKVCGYASKLCNARDHDDCFEGINIPSIEFCHDDHDDHDHNLNSCSIYRKYVSSLNNWNELKNMYDNCYTYSSWSNRSVTTIKVLNGIVSSRSYRSFDNFGNLTNYYNETVKLEIGTNILGADAITMDELYLECPEYLLVNRNRNYIRFKTNKDNILSHCLYSPMDCQDDCKVGIRVLSLVFCGEETTTQAP